MKQSRDLLTDRKYTAPIETRNLSVGYSMAGRLEYSGEDRCLCVGIVFVRIVFVCLLVLCLYACVGIVFVCVCVGIVFVRLYCVYVLVLFLYVGTVCQCSVCALMLCLCVDIVFVCRIVFVCWYGPCVC